MSNQLQQRHRLATQYLLKYPNKTNDLMDLYLKWSLAEINQRISGAEPGPTIGSFQAPMTAEQSSILKDMISKINLVHGFSFIPSTQIVFENGRFYKNENLGEEGGFIVAPTKIITRKIQDFDQPISDQDLQDLLSMKSSYRGYTHLSWGTVVHPHSHDKWSKSQCYLVTPLRLQQGRIMRLNPVDTMIIDYVSYNSNESFLVCQGLKNFQRLLQDLDPNLLKQLEETEKYWKITEKKQIRHEGGRVEERITYQYNDQPGIQDLGVINGIKVYVTYNQETNLMRNFVDQLIQQNYQDNIYNFPSTFTMPVKFGVDSYAYIENFLKYIGDDQSRMLYRFIRSNFYDSKSFSFNFGFNLLKDYLIKNEEELRRIIDNQEYIKNEPRLETRITMEEKIQNFKEDLKMNDQQFNDELFNFCQKIMGKKNEEILQMITDFDQKMAEFNSWTEDQRKSKKKVTFWKEYLDQYPFVLIMASENKKENLFYTLWKQVLSGKASQMGKNYWTGLVNTYLTKQNQFNPDDFLYMDNGIIITTKKKQQVVENVSVNYYYDKIKGITDDQLIFFDKHSFCYANPPPTPGYQFIDLIQKTFVYECDDTRFATLIRLLNNDTNSGMILYEQEIFQRTLNSQEQERYQETLKEQGVYFIMIAWYEFYLMRSIKRDHLKFEKNIEESYLKLWDTLKTILFIYAFYDLEYIYDGIDRSKEKQELLEMETEDVVNLVVNKSFVPVGIAKMDQMQEIVNYYLTQPIDLNQPPPNSKLQQLYEKLK